MTTTGMEEMDVVANDEFDALLNDVLRAVANPEVPERVQAKARVRVLEMTAGAHSPVHPRSQNRDLGHPIHGQVEQAPRRPAAVFAPEVFLAKMRPKRSARSTAYAVLAHAAAILLVCLAVSAKVRIAPTTKTPDVTELITPPPIAPDVRTAGGGGGSNDHAPAANGQLPKLAPVQITPPKAPVEARIKMPDPALEAVTNLKMPNPDMPNFGMPNSTALGNSLGSGKGTGIGPGDGPGLGVGSGGNCCGGLRRVGGGVSMPVVIHEVEPEFSEEARRTKSPGVVTVDLIVDANGMPQNVHVARGAGMGLDEKAVEAVKQYRFKPAMENGKPVPVEMNVVVTFEIE